MEEEEEQEEAREEYTVYTNIYKIWNKSIGEK